MSKGFKTDYLKIIFVGIPLSFFIWAILFMFAAFLTHDPIISKYSSIGLTIIFMIAYLYLSIKHASKIGAAIDNSKEGFNTSEGLLKCSDCGCESEAEEAFRRYKAGLSGQETMLCPECWSNRYISMSKMSLSGIGIAFVGGLIILYFDPSNFSAALLINIGLLYLFMMMTVIPHELGHLIVGRLMGYEVFRVIIGYGQALLKPRFLGCEWEFRPIPIGGVTLIATRSSRFFRLRRFVMLLAGPLVNVIFIVLLFWILPAGGSLGSYSSRSVALDIDFFLANAILLVLNLWPRKITTAAGVIENDGMALLTIPFSKRKKIDEHLTAYYFYSSSELCRQKQYGQAVKVCEEGLGLYPDAIQLRIQLGIVFLALNEFDKARASFMELHSYKDIKAGEKMIILNNIAYANLLSGRTDLMEEANRFSEEAYKNIPWVPAIKGTRGAVLVETGHVDEGLQLLQKAYATSSESEGKALNAAHIALGEKLRGNIEECVRYLKIAQTLDPQCQLLDRVHEELAE